mmetsp:Transcript_9569/g.27383  ORF Transcript_9569/g.27383 Transcript_9569/m.27383 type:complete len:445 (-) Transcript_9569:306-1640(-)
MQLGGLVLGSPATVATGTTRRSTVSSGGLVLAALQLHGIKSQCAPLFGAVPRSTALMPRTTPRLMRSNTCLALGSSSVLATAPINRRQGFQGNPLNCRHSRSARPGAGGDGGRAPFWASSKAGSASSGWTSQRWASPFSNIRHQDSRPCARIISSRAAAEGSDDIYKAPPEEVSEEQWKVVKHDKDSALRVIAGPGSGKTRMMAHRISHLIEAEGVPPQKIMAITFTNKGANEGYRRLDSTIGKLKADRVTTGTIHSVALRILRKDIESIPEELRRSVKADFIPVDEEEAQSLMGDVLIRVFEGKPQPRSKPDAKKYLSQISAVKNSRRRVIRDGDEFEVAFRRQSPNKKPLASLGLVYEKYEELLGESNAVDYDNLLLLVLEMFHSCRGAVSRYRNTWHYVMVDEFQDTNIPQYEFVGPSPLLAPQSTRPPSPGPRPSPCVAM